METETPDHKAGAATQAAVDRGIVSDFRNDRAAFDGEVLLFSCASLLSVYHAQEVHEEQETEQEQDVIKTQCY